MNTAPKKIRLLLVDDHQLVRDGLRARLGDEADIEVVGEAGTGQEALSAAAILRPDLALVDIGLPDISGIQLTTTLNDRFPELRVLILSMYDNREYVLSALRAGACGYVLKDAPSNEIISAIKGVAVGCTYYSTTVAKALAAAGTLPPLLTDREKEVLILLAQGDSNKRVAQKLDVSVRTVETHRLNLRRKLGIETPAGLTSYALKQRWIEV
jgi:DNA-binding NarL/FixJ family response regulator